jgi:transcriptional regulator of NAD metabolism
VNPESRRERILQKIIHAEKTVSASALAKEFEVSRQVIVGDIALLRAQGHEIVATARGYMIPQVNEAHRYLGKLACQHTAKDTQCELYTIVDLGAVVENVIVEHGLYGEISGSLNLADREDVDSFMDRLHSSEIKLLSELTMGVHLHTVACRDRDHFEQVRQALDDKGYLYSN